jgi:hypothetical protein
VPPKAAVLSQDRAFPALTLSTGEVLAPRISHDNRANRKARRFAPPNTLCPLVQPFAAKCVYPVQRLQLIAAAKGLAASYA